MTWTLDTCTDIYWHWQRLWIPVLISYGNDKDCVYFDWLLVAMTGNDWERADLLALVCCVFCEFVTFPLVSWVRCGTWLYRFLIFAPLLTLILVLIASCNDSDFEYFYWPLVPKAATLDTLLTSRGNNWVSGFFSDI